MLERGDVLIQGTKSSGKTTLAIELFRTSATPRNIFINSNDENVPGIKIKDPNDIINFLPTLNAINFIPDRNADMASMELEMLKNNLFDIGAHLYPKQRPRLPWLRLFADEAQRYGNKFSNVLDDMSNRSARYGIQMIYITQYPANLSHRILTQIQTHIFFDLRDYTAKYFQTYNLPYDQITAHTKKPYHFCVYEYGQPLKLYNPVKI